MSDGFLDLAVPAFVPPAREIDACARGRNEFVRAPIRVAVQEQFRTAPDDQNAAFTGVYRSIRRLIGW